MPATSPTRDRLASAALGGIAALAADRALAWLLARRTISGGDRADAASHATLADLRARSEALTAAIAKGKADCDRGWALAQQWSRQLHQRRQDTPSASSSDGGAQ